MTTVSNTTTAVLNNIAKSYSNGSSFPTGDPGVFFTTNVGTSAAGTAGFIAPLAGTVGSAPATQFTLTTTNVPTSSSTYVWPQGWQGQQVTIPNDNTWYPNIGIPYYGDSAPNGGFVFPSPKPATFKMVPDLELLEEGVHDIPGGKVIIKKIKISEEQLDNAIQEALGHEASPEEKATIIKEIEELAASEEREV